MHVTISLSPSNSAIRLKRSTACASGVAMKSEPVKDLALAKSGDSDALDRLLQRHHERLTAISQRELGPWLGAKSRASDLLQGAYLDVVRSIGTFRASTEDQFVAWVGKLVANRARDLVRFYRAQRRKSPITAADITVLQNTADLRQSTPSEVAVADEQLARVRRAINELSPVYREVLSLCLSEGLSPSEAAPRLGRTAGSTRVLLCRARAALMAAVEAKP